MQKVVTGLFDGPASARYAMQKLEQAGFDRSRIILVNSDNAGEHARRTANETAGVLACTAGGAGIAGVAGLLLGLATGTETGDEARHVLSDYEIPSMELEVFTRAIQNGNSVVVVPAAEEQAARAQSLLDNSGALDLDTNSESEFRRDFQNRFEQTGYTYRQLAPAYRYGHQLAADDLYRGQDWNVVESSVYKQWEHDNPNTWEQVKDAVKQGFLHN